MRGGNAGIGAPTPRNQLETHAPVSIDSSC